MHSEQRLLEGKCATCLQVHEGLLLLLASASSEPFLLYHLPEFLVYSCQIPRSYRMCNNSPNHTISQDLLFPPTVKFLDSALSFSLLSQTLLVIHILPKAIPGLDLISLLQTINGTYVLKNYCLKHHANCMSNSIGCSFQIKILMPKKKKNSQTHAARGVKY